LRDLPLSGVGAQPLKDNNGDATGQQGGHTKGKKNSS
jgi:hypothetical protein